MNTILSAYVTCSISFCDDDIKNYIDRHDLLEKVDDDIGARLLRLDIGEEANLLIIQQNALIEELESRIARYQFNISAIRARQNGSIPRINVMLPHEILCGIFTEVVLSYWVIGSSMEYRWFKVAHVCRYWRDVVFS